MPLEDELCFGMQPGTNNFRSGSNSRKKLIFAYSNTLIQYLRLYVIKNIREQKRLMEFLKTIIMHKDFLNCSAP